MGEIIKGDRDVSVVYVSKERELVCHFEHLVNVTQSTAAIKGINHTYMIKATFNSGIVILCIFEEELLFYEVRNNRTVEHDGCKGRYCR